MIPEDVMEELDVDEFQFTPVKEYEESPSVTEPEAITRFCSGCR
jgi:hypothetical protein